MTSAASSSTASEDAPLSDAIAQLFSRTAAGIRPGLETTSRLLAALKNPQDRLAAIHVAGTNGKGSVCSIVERILRAHNLTTGCFTSPHLVELGERFRINGKPLPEVEVLELVDQVTQADTQSRGGDRAATFFECTAAMAFQAFVQKGVQASVIEVGLGGRWDATNVLNPLVSVITPIGLDHQDFLGHTLAEIAGEKAGIIKPGVPVIIGMQDPEAEAVLRDTAADRGSLCCMVSESVSVKGVQHTLEGLCFHLETQQASYGRLQVPLCGKHQVENIALAVLAAEVWMQQVGGMLQPERVKQALNHVTWPGRMQVVKDDPPFILDGAHNIAAAKRLRESIGELMPSDEGYWVLGMMKDKDVSEVMAVLAPCMRELAVVALDEPRACSQDFLLKQAELLGLKAHVWSLDEACVWACEQAAKHESYATLVGSIHLLGAFYQTEFARQHEISLEWGS